MKLKDLSTVSVPEARTIKINVWDNNMIALIEKAILKGQHRYWRLARVYERAENAYEGITHFFFNRPVEGSNWWDGIIDQDSFKFQKLQEGLNAASQHADAITLELISRH